MTHQINHPDSRDNMHDVDALASVREKIAELKKIEEALRDRILKNPNDRRGQMYVAEIVMSSQKRICQDKIKELIGSVDAVRKSVDVTTVRVFKLWADQ